MKKIIIKRSTANKIAYAIDAAALAGVIGISWLEQRKIDKEEDHTKRLDMIDKAYYRSLYPLYAAGVAFFAMAIFCKNPE